MRQIQDYLGFQLLQVHKAHRSRAEAALSKLGIHTGQEMLLLQLWIEEGMPQSQLAACMGVEPPTANAAAHGACGIDRTKTGSRGCADLPRLPDRTWPRA